ncbi:hypothetical protein C3Y87_13895 [Carbonactinospora thermoautotrophica]|uniref:Uncharacterized protein n=1 Tax=Carbonactinospora thermoautotrophica TaxID=1469144 RepID=A0A132NKF6_9ACTN|nr:hypothetical protein [Carbonactinospora thermoautotrophica]KWX04161.1 hypothetical protein TH66_09700 [Carbonactinospora thermoautotrophica]KWX10611.1 hypothetical protein TR74_02595 [Carbonactinospora thermoautotrophica]MCX9192486.1 hypothetical protein [Carbonactinospora thermoautotrophica]
MEQREPDEPTDRLAAAAGYGLALSVPVLLALEPLAGQLTLRARVLVLVGSMLCAVLVAGFTARRNAADGSAPYRREGASGESQVLVGQIGAGRQA